MAKLCGALTTLSIRLADTGKGTVAKPTEDRLDLGVRLADTGKGTVAKLSGSPTASS